uniref:Uncharacterized protein n=1 Tax=Percolomonas cosmopolitus TaxID=63605 RepID=A0A7S1KSD2_9EUKA
MIDEPSLDDFFPCHPHWEGNSNNHDTLEESTPLPHLFPNDTASDIPEHRENDLAGTSRGATRDNDNDFPKTSPSAHVESIERAVGELRKKRHAFTNEQIDRLRILTHELERLVSDGRPASSDDPADSSTTPSASPPAVQGDRATQDEQSGEHADVEKHFDSTHDVMIFLLENINSRVKQDEIGIDRFLQTIQNSPMNGLDDTKPIIAELVNFCKEKPWIAEYFHSDFGAKWRRQVHLKDLESSLKIVFTSLVNFWVYQCTWSKKCNDPLFDGKFLNARALHKAGICEYCMGQYSSSSNLCRHKRCCDGKPSCPVGKTSDEDIECGSEKAKKFFRDGTPQPTLGTKRNREEASSDKNKKKRTS